MGRIVHTDFIASAESAEKYDVYNLTIHGILFSLLVTPNQQHMNSNTPETRLEKPSLTIVKKEDADKLHARLITIKKMEKKSEILLPPPEEKYIKVKKHDFL